jgi:hypothetical protein
VNKLPVELLRLATVLLALATSATAMSQTISDDFSKGFGSVAWGTDLSALVAKFPGGYEEFSTAPGRVSYALNFDDPVLGIARRGLYVLYGVGIDSKVDNIEIQVPYDQTSVLISTLAAKFGPERSLEVRGIVTTYRWPSNKGLALAVRTTNNSAYGLTTLTIGKKGQTPDRTSSVGKSSSLPLERARLNGAQRVPQCSTRCCKSPWGSCRGWLSRCPIEHRQNEGILGVPFDGGLCG